MTPAATTGIVRTMRPVRAKHLPALVLGVLALGITTLGGLASAQATGKPASGPTVTGALGSLKRGGAIPATVYQQDYSAYLAAQRSLKKLTGTRRTELGGVLANVQAIAAAHGFIPSRLPALFMTLERNRTWWTTGPLLAGRVRVSFPESKLVWEYYPGQGLEIQWLGTFGEGNGFYLSGHENANLRQLVSEIIPLATKRAGGIAWEYMFQFDGGLPPWTSGLSQGTALQVLSRAGSRFKEPADLAAAQEALGIFKAAPPSGVRVASSLGAHYLEYTYAPRDRILNGEIQALVGLYDYTSLTHDPVGLTLFEAGDAEARVRVPSYDTGAWSMYDQYGESDLSYHELLTEFLSHLCGRTGKGAPFNPTAAPAPTPAPAPAPTPTPAPSTSTTPTSTPPAGGASGGTTETGGASPARHVAGASTPGARSATIRSAASGRAAASTSTSSPPIAADAIYCTTATHFTADLHTPPVLSLITTTLPTSSRAGVQTSLSKISTVRLTVRLSGKTVWTNSATLERGRPRLLWVTPSKAGSYSITLTATDLAGNFASATGSITVAKGAKAH
jgi:hypothetical protein